MPTGLGVDKVKPKNDLVPPYILCESLELHSKVMGWPLGFRVNPSPLEFLELIGGFLGQGYWDESLTINISSP